LWAWFTRYFVGRKKHPMKYVFPANTFTNHGLGNELFPIAKAHIAAMELGATPLLPSWKRNFRNYRRFFGNRYGDWIQLSALKRLLPVFHLSEEEYLETGKVDFGDAVRVFAEKYELQKKKAYVVTTHGMWGFYHPIRRARSYVASLLLNTRFTRENLYQFAKQSDPSKLTVAIHMRLTDFAECASVSNQNKVNTRLPISWYSLICRNIKHHFGDRVQFYLITDGTERELQSFIQEFSPLTSFHQTNCDISDLLIMAHHCDLVVCSVSTYSLWGVFLSDSPYIWYQPQLTQENNDGVINWSRWDGGFVDMLVARPETIPDQSEAPMQRGYAVGDTGEICDNLYSHLKNVLWFRNVSRDIVSGGSCPVRLHANR